MSEQEAAGLLADESFINYCLGHRQDDVAYWDEYLRQHPHERKTIEELKNIVLLSTTSVKELEMSAQLEKLKQRITYREAIDMIRFEPKKRFSKWLMAAAVTGLLLTGFLSIYFFSYREQPVVTAVANYVTQKAERKTFMLPDGSKVVLNAESEILLDKNFNQQNRVLELTGEAYFDVVHNKALPFVVKTSRMDVKVLGTAFNVKAYKGDATSETSLIRGSVELSLKNENRKITLSPNEKYLLRTPASETTTLPQQKNSGVSTLSGLLPVRVSKKDSAIAEVSWAENKLVFVDERFEDIAQQLSRWYGITIEIADPSLKDILYTASFRNEGLEDVLSALQFTKAFTFQRKNETVMIYR